MAPPPFASSRGCLRVRQSGALRVLVALVRIFDLWAALYKGYWGVWDSFAAPQDFGLLGLRALSSRDASY